jgi:uncharacterized protein (TIGR02246 family)
MDAIVMIEDVLRQLIDAWNRGDAEAFADRFAPDAEYTTGTGQCIRGRAQIAALVVAGVKVALVDGPSVECDGTTATGRFGWATPDNQAGAARRGTITVTERPNAAR